MLVACGQSSQPEDVTPVTQTVESTPAALTVETVNQANSTLEKLTGARLGEIQVQSIAISPTGNLSVDALDPAKPTEFNQYVAYPDGRTDIRPYDYGGAENYDALVATLFGADLVSPEILVNSWEDSFNRVQGDRTEMSASGATVARESMSGEIELYIVNGPERDRQTVYYDPAGNFLRVS